ncbi:hypothetical protein [Streptomyces sp. NPDC096193]|uniref:hypothetical protein n=1 Tax=Streptomyces sp. NPDC096193 TaxID=3155821 RepID=UPI003317E211
MTNNGGRSNGSTGDGLRPPDAARRPRISGPVEGWAAREGDRLFDRFAGHRKTQDL